MCSSDLDQDVHKVSSKKILEGAIAAINAEIKKTGGKGGEALKKAIESGTFSTPIGTLTFNDLHEVKKDIQVQVVKGKAFHRHSVISDPVLLAPPTKAK